MFVFFCVFNIEEGALFLKASRFIKAIKGGVRVKLDIVRLDIVELLNVVGYNRAYKEGIKELIINIIVSIVDIFSKEVIVLQKADYNYD